MITNSKLVVVEVSSSFTRWRHYFPKYQYRPLQQLLLVLNCRDCRVLESISSSSYAESCFKNIMHLRDRGCVRTLRPLFVYATATGPVRTHNSALTVTDHYLCNCSLDNSPIYR